MEGRAAHRLTGSQPAHAGEADLIQDPTFKYRYLYLPDHSGTAGLLWLPPAPATCTYQPTSLPPRTTTYDLRLRLRRDDFPLPTATGHH